MRLTLVALLLITAALATTAAQAADPESGTVSAASPTVSWKGQVISAGITNNAWAQDPSAPCEAPACDTFALEVADSANLVLKLKGFKENTAGGDPGCGIRVTAPSGEQTYHSGTCGPSTEMRVTIKNAPKGSYTIDVADSHVVSQPEDYEASATLAVPPPAVAPAPAPTVPPASEPAPSLTVKVPALSAKRLKRARRFTATLTSSAPLTAVRATLTRGKKRVAGGRLASLDGTGKLAIKVKKGLKKGTYRLRVGGRDAQGREVVDAVKVKVRR